MSDNSWIKNIDELDCLNTRYCQIQHYPLTQKCLRVSEVTLSTGGKSPIIVHKKSSQLIRILKGKVKAYIGGIIYDCNPGTTIFVAPGTEHSFKAIDEEVKAFIVHVPAIDPKDDHYIIQEDF